MVIKRFILKYWRTVIKLYSCFQWNTRDQLLFWDLWRTELMTTSSLTTLSSEAAFLVSIFLLNIYFSKYQLRVRYTNCGVCSPSNHARHLVALVIPLCVTTGCLTNCPGLSFCLPQSNTTCSTQHITCRWFVSHDTLGGAQPALPNT